MGVMGMTPKEVLHTMRVQHLRIAHLVAEGEAGNWVLIDLQGHKVADVDTAVAQSMVATNQLWPTPNPSNRPRGKYENEIYHHPWN